MAHEMIWLPASEMHRATREKPLVKPALEKVRTVLHMEPVDVTLLVSPELARAVEQTELAPSEGVKDGGIFLPGTVLDWYGWTVLVRLGGGDNYVEVVPNEEAANGRQ